MLVSRVEEAYRRLHPRLWHALLAYSGDVEVANDAEADAFGQALRRGDQIDDVDAWVWRCAFRVAAGLLQDQRKRQPHATLEVAEAMAVDGALNLSASEPSVTEFLSQLGRLTDQQRAVVALRYLGDFKSAEIAELLGTSAGTVRVQLHRAHRQLRETMFTDAEERSDA